MTKVLFIEDDKLLLSIYVMKFSQEGFETATAEDGLQGMKQIMAFKPDLVVLDLMLPMMNGVDVLKFVRSSSALKHLPVVILSNAYMTEIVHQAAAAGATLGLSKSRCTPKLLVGIVRNLLAGKLLEVDPSALIMAAPKAGASQTSAPKEAPPSVIGTPDAANPSAPVAPTANPGRSAEAPDRMSQNRIVEDFAKQAPETIADLKRSCSLFAQRCGTPLQPGTIEDLEKRVRAFSNIAAMVGLGDVADFTSAIDALLVHLQGNHSDMTPSVLLTISHAVDALEKLLEHKHQLASLDVTDFKILAVDDDPFCLKIIAMALRKARLLASTVDNVQAAWKMIQENRYDLLLLDVLLPGASGFELCRQVRLLPGYESTPVIFVTSQSDFQSQARSRLSGGTDLIAKPFLPLELAVKALTRLLEHHIAAHTQKPPLVLMDFKANVA